MDETQSWVELQVWFKVLGERELDFHGVCTAVVQDDLLSVELLVYQNIQIVLFLLNIDRHIDTPTTDLDWDGLGVVLVLKEQCEVLIDLGELHWDECELYLRAGIPIDLCGSLEGDLSKELLKDVLLRWCICLGALLD